MVILKFILLFVSIIESENFEKKIRFQNLQNPEFGIKKLDESDKHFFNIFRKQRDFSGNFMINYDLILIQEFLV